LKRDFDPLKLNHPNVLSPSKVPFKCISNLWLLFASFKLCEACGCCIVIYVLMNLCKILGTMVILMLNNGEIMNLKGVGWDLVLDL